LRYIAIPWRTYAMNRHELLWYFVLVLGPSSTLLSGGPVGAGGTTGEGEVKLQAGVLTEVEAELTDADPVSQGKFRKSYKLQLVKGQEYVFEMRALYPRFFDPYLILMDANGRVLKEDDDSGGKPNARLTFEPKKSADHVLVVTTFPQGQTGAFRLTVGEVGARAQPSALQLRNGRAEVEGQLTDREGREKGKRCRVFSCDLAKGMTYLVRLESGGFDSYLYLLGPNGQLLAEDDDGAGQLNAQLLWTATEEGPHRVLVTSLNGMQTGAFHLTVAAVAPDHVLPAKLKNQYVRMTGQLPTKAPIYDDKPCRAYSVRLEEGKTYQVDLVSTDFDAYLYLLGPDGKELARDDDSGGDLHARIIYPVKATGTYRIQACSLGPQGAGKYFLVIQERPPQLDLAKALILPWLNGQAKATGKLAASDPRVQGKACKAYAVQLQESKTYRINLVSDDFDAYLFLLGPDRKLLAQDDDSGGDLNARLAYTARATGTFYILACSLGDPGDGNYALTVTESTEK
jgi:hypothetical protein